MADVSLAQVFMDSANLGEMTDKMLADNYRGYIEFINNIQKELKRRGFDRASGERGIFKFVKVTKEEI